MENILSVLQQIFMGKEDTSIRIGLSEFKKPEAKIQIKRRFTKRNAPQQLKLSELMRKGTA